MSSCCDCTPTYTWLFGSDKVTMRRTSTPIPDSKNRSDDSFASTTDNLLYLSWLDGLFHGSTHRRACKSCEGDSLDRLWDDSTPTSLNTGSEPHPADIAGSGSPITNAKSANVLAPILPATAGGPGSGNFPVGGVVPAGYAVGTGAAVAGNEVIAAGYANCPSPGMNLVPGFLPIGASISPVPGQVSTAMNLLAIPAPATIVPVPVGANYAIAPGPVNFAFPTGLTVNVPAPVPTGANLVVGSVPITVNIPTLSYPAGQGNFSPYQVLVQPLQTPSCNTTLYCNFFLGCNPDGACCSQQKTQLNGYA